MTPDKFSAFFEANFARKCDFRAEGFRAAFQALEEMGKQFYTLVETGCSRKMDGDGVVYGNQVDPEHPWYPGGDQGPWADGQSTLIFDSFLKFYPGHLFTVDISAENCQVARQNSSRNVTVKCSDSVIFLYQLGRFLSPQQRIDALYLDSFDLDWNAPHASALHHIKELIAAAPWLRPGSIVFVDDNLNAGLRGKGLYVAEYMRDIGARVLVDGYQTVWEWP